MDEGKAEFLKVYYEMYGELEQLIIKYPRQVRIAVYSAHLAMAAVLAEQEEFAIEGLKEDIELVKNKMAEVLLRGSLRMTDDEHISMKINPPLRNCECPVCYLRWQEDSGRTIYPSDWFEAKKCAYCQENIHDDVTATQSYKILQRQMDVLESVNFNRWPAILKRLFSHVAIKWSSDD